MRYDLHTHSLCSDGTLSPTALVQRAHRRGIDVLALTDHDCIDGLSEAQSAADQLGLTLINGVEISVTWQEQNIHIIGLKINPNNEVLQAGLAKLREIRQQRTIAIGQRLADYGIAGAFAGARALTQGQIVSRTHFARFLVINGYAQDVNEVFTKFLVRNKPGYVATQWATLSEAIQWINDAGGQAILAHPSRYPLSAMQLHELISQFHNYGGVGLELISGRHNDSLSLTPYTKMFGLLASLGSDFHTPEPPNNDLGHLPELYNQLTPIWINW